MIWLRADQPNLRQSESEVLPLRHYTTPPTHDPT